MVVGGEVSGLPRRVEVTHLMPRVPGEGEGEGEREDVRGGENGG